MMVKKIPCSSWHLPDEMRRARPDFQATWLLQVLSDRDQSHHLFATRVREILDPSAYILYESRYGIEFYTEDEATILQVVLTLDGLVYF